jgi:hypothetical protein
MKRNAGQTCILKDIMQNFKLITPPIPLALSPFETLLPDCFLEKKDEHNCNTCGQSTSKRCSKCKLAWYCNHDCQKSDYKRHKKLCNTLLVFEDFPDEIKARDEKDIILSCYHCGSQRNVSEPRLLKPHCRNCLFLRGSHEGSGHEMYTPCIDCVPKGRYHTTWSMCTQKIRF